MPQKSSLDWGHDRALDKLPLVFLGPTLPQPEAGALLTACFRPPARRGDIYRALADGYTIIVLIDGEFHGSPSVWQREIADALAEGVVIHGASSMGAIRAAELHSFGMIGHGRIFEWYRDGVIDADDEVALVYGPAECGYPTWSEPLVNIRATLEAAVPDVIAPEDRDLLIEFMKGLYFPERSFAALMEGGPAAVWPTERRNNLARFLSEARVDQKRDDAIGALTAVSTNVGKRHSPRGPTQRERLWKRDRLVAEGVVPRQALGVAAIARCVGLSAEEVKALHHELSTMFFVAQWGRVRGIAPTSGDLVRQRASFPAVARVSVLRLDGLLAVRALATAAMRTFCIANGATGPEAAGRAIIREWAHDNGIGDSGLEGDALVDWVIESGPNHFGYLWSFDIEMIETLWLLGRAEGLRSWKES